MPTATSVTKPRPLRPLKVSGWSNISLAMRMSVTPSRYETRKTTGMRRRRRSIEMSRRRTGRMDGFARMYGVGSKAYQVETASEIRETRRKMMPWTNFAYFWTNFAYLFLGMVIGVGLMTFFLFTSGHPRNRR